MWPFKKKLEPVIIQPIEPQQEGLPCPLDVVMQGRCICITCKHALHCPMEVACRNDGCRGTIGGCTIYDCEGDSNAENKRKVFKDRAIFEPDVFRFSSKQSKENPRS